VAGFLVGCAGHDVAVFETAPVAVRSYDSLLGEIAQTTDTTGSLTTNTLATVTVAGQEYPIVVVRYQGAPPMSGAPHAPKTGPSVLITAGVHGNEPAGVEWARELVSILSREPGWTDGLAIDIVPVVNPWGWVHDVRYNGEGRDINRDFSAFRTGEARSIRALLEEHSYDLVIDHHEDGQATGVYIYQYGLRDDQWSRDVIEDLRSRRYLIEQDISMIILTTDDGLIDAPMWGLRYMKMTDQLSLTNYVRLEGTRRVYTFETPTRLPMETRVAAHRRVFEMLVDRAAYEYRMREL